MKTSPLIIGIFSCVFLTVASLKAVTLDFTNVMNLGNLSDYYVYFQQGSATEDANLEVTYTLTNGVTNSFNFNTSDPTDQSILTTNQIDLASIQSITVDSLTAGRLFVSYGELGAGITYTNATYTNFSGPSRVAGSPGSTNPYQFYEGNATAGAGNFDTTYIDAVSFGYALSNNNTSQYIGATNFNAQYYRNQLGGIVSSQAFVTNSSGNLVSILGNGNITTPLQFPSYSSYLTQLASNNTTVLIGYTSNAAVASSGRASVQKQYGVESYSVNGVTYSGAGVTMAVWSSFDGSVATNSSTLSNASSNFAFGTNSSGVTNTQALILTNGSVQIVYWGGTNSSGSNSPYTPTNVYINTTNNLYTNLAVMEQAYSNSTLSTIIRQSPQGTNGALSTPGYSYNIAYSNFITTFSAIPGIAAGNALEQGVLYVNDFNASINLGLAGSTNVDTNTGVAYQNEYSSMWWGSLTAPSYGVVQTNSSNYDNYGAYIALISASNTYGNSYSDRFTGVTNILNDFSGSDTLTAYVGGTLLDTTAIPEPSYTVALLLFLTGFAAFKGFQRRKKA
jgi:hypothetical protein